MKKRLIAFFMALTLLFTLSACSKDNNKNENGTNKENSGNEENKAGEDSAGIDKEQYLNVFMDSQPTTLDPSKGSDTYGLNIITNTLEPLVRVSDDENGKSLIVGAGAEKWEISEDGRTYTFHLRDNKWNDKTPVTSKDYLYGIKKSLDPKTAAPYSSWLFYIENAQKINGGKENMDKLGVETPDDKTLVIKLEHPVPYFMEIVGQRVYFPQREDLDKKYGDTYSTSPETTPCCGPFTLPEWTINSKILLEKNPEFWDAANVKLDKVNINIIGDVNSVYNALKTGELDYASVSDPKWKGDFLKDDRYEFVENVNPATGFMCINADSKIIKNAKMRQAFSIALDRQELIDATMNSTPIAAYDFVPPTILCQGKPFNEEGKGLVKELENEHKDAKELLIEGMKEAGLGDDPKTLKVSFIGSGTDQKVRTMTEFIKQQYESKLGITLEVNQSEWNSFFSQLQAGQYDIGWLSYGATYNDPSTFLDLFNSSAPTITTNWKNAEYDEAVTKAQVEADVEKRIELLKKAEKILIHDEAIIIPINYPRSNTFIRKYVKGASFNFFNTEGYMRIYTQGR